MTRVHLCVFALVSCIICTAQAADLDQSTPKAAALSFAKVLEAGDDAAVKQLVVGTDQDMKVLDATMEFTRSVKKLRDSAVKKFADKADEVTGGGLNVDSAKALEDTEIKEDGDTATVVATKPKPSTTYLKKVNGKWMVNLTDTLKSASTPDQSLGQFETMLRGWSSAINETAGEIDAGKYPLPADAAQALNVKMMAALKSAAPTTAPSTNPAAAAPVPVRQD